MARNISFVFAGFIAGIIIGGYVFSDTQERSFLALDRCQETCLQEKELWGLLGSVGIQKSPALPLIVLETDKTLVIRHPRPQSPTHFVIIPKKDIKNLDTLNAQDKEYYWDILAVAQMLIRDNNLIAYQLLTNGPAYQDITYLHFQLIAE